MRLTICLFIRTIQIYSFTVLIMDVSEITRFKPETMMKRAAPVEGERWKIRIGSDHTHQKNADPKL